MSKSRGDFTPTYLDVYRLASFKGGSRINGAAIECHDCKKKGKQENVIIERRDLSNGGIRDKSN